MARNKISVRKAQKSAPFNVSLSDAISQLSLTPDEIKQLDSMTRGGSIAYARVGLSVYYRAETLTRLFKR